MSSNVRKKTELLSPAGSFDTLKAVALAGADAVYAAGQKFGARAYAGNLTKQELLEALDYLHIKGKRLYLTVNTLLKGSEVEELYEELHPLYEGGLDGVIVQDMGVLHFVREHFPDLPIHASTQMTITGAYGAKMLLDAGCRRIVTARELSLKEISHIYETTGAEIESFIHGALCYCYSGQCLLSSMIGGRSGNRGRCAQPCRLPYDLCDSRGSSLLPEKQKENYLLSPKDLCTVELIPQLIQSGVHSFKIEGRMKQAEYAAGVTRIYRNYIDRYESDPEAGYQVSEEDKRTLEHLGSRCGFTDGYYTRHNGKTMITFSKPSHEKKKGQKQEVLWPEPREKKEKIKGILRLLEETPASLMLQYKDIQIQISGEQVQLARKQPVTRESVLDKMKKTGNTPFVFEELQVEMDEYVFIPAGALNRLRRDGLEQLREEILKKYRRAERKIKITESPIPAEMCKKAMNEGRTELRVLTETLEQLQVALRQPEVSRIYLDTLVHSGTAWKQQLREQAEQVHDSGKECYLALPYIFRMETARRFRDNWKQIKQTGVDGYLVRNYEEIQFLKEMGINPECVQGDYNLYGYSNEALRGLSRLPLLRYTLPVELNFKELRELDCRNSELLLYGHQPLMLSSQCVQKNTIGCRRKEKVCYLKDRYGKLFPVKNRCEDCYNVIYNISPLVLFHHLEAIQSLHPAGVRLSFTIEEQKETERIFDCCRQAFLGRNHRESYPSDYTNGHFKRGVE